MAKSKATAKKVTATSANLTKKPASKLPKVQKVATNNTKSAQVQQSAKEIAAEAAREEIESQEELKRAEAARNAVFGTPELLEGIVTQLSPRSITKTKGASKWFKGVIAGSTAITKKDFPEATPTVKHWSIAEKYATRHYVPQGQGDGIVPDHQIVAMNRTIFTGDPARLAKRTPVSAARGQVIVLRRQFGQELFRYMRTKNRQSFFNLQLTWPPCPDVEINFVFRVGAPLPSWNQVLGTVSSSLSRSTGVTVGDVFDHVLFFKADARKGARGSEYSVRYGETKEVETRPRYDLRSGPRYTVDGVTFCVGTAFATPKSDAPPHDTVAENIMELEKKYGAEAQVQQLSIALTNMVAPTRQEIQEIEADF